MIACTFKGFATDFHTPSRLELHFQRPPNFSLLVLKGKYSSTLYNIRFAQYCGLNSLVFDHHVCGHLSMNFQKKKKFHLILDISILTYSKWRPYSSWEVITIFTYSNSRLQTSSVNLSLHRSNAENQL